MHLLLFLIKYQSQHHRKTMHGKVVSQNTWRNLKNSYLSCKRHCQRHIQISSNSIKLNWQFLILLVCSLVLNDILTPIHKKINECHKIIPVYSKRWGMPSDLHSVYQSSCRVSQTYYQSSCQVSQTCCQSFYRVCQIADQVSTVNGSVIAVFQLKAIHIQHKEMLFLYRVQMFTCSFIMFF